MTRLAFTNNAVTTLASGLADDASTITLTDDFGFDSLSGGDAVQILTITDPNGVQDPEIVTATGVPGSNQRTVVRGLEGTIAQVWSAGAIVSARITAETLLRFPQATDLEVSLFPEAPVGRNWIGSSVLQFGGFPVLQVARSDMHAASEYMDANLSREVVGGTLPLNLGTAPTWTSGVNYTHGAVVAPPTPDGWQYCFEPAVLGGASQTTTTPEFSSLDPCAALMGGTVVGSWFPINPSALEQVISAILGSKGLVVTEVGFICMGHGGGSAPVVSIGADSAPTRFASSVALSQITAAGHIHRIPISSGGAMCGSKLTFALVTPSSGNFHGRFYWKGFFAELLTV